MKNQFEPFGVAEGIEDALAEQSAEYFKKFGKEMPDPFKDNYNYKIIENIEKTLGKYQLLDKPLMIKEKDWLHKDDQSSLMNQPLPTMPTPKVAQMPAQMNQQTGLTRSESALLSPSEQVIARRT